MSTNNYAVRSTGEVDPDQKEVTVAAKFGGLFNISTEQAAAYTSQRKVINNNLSAEEANKYATAMAEIGLIVEVINEAANDSVAKNDTKNSQETSEVSLFFCPKCHTRQDESEECTKCGIIFARYRTTSKTLDADQNKEIRSADSTKHIQSDNDTVLSIIVDTIRPKNAISVIIGLALLVGFFTIFSSGTSSSKQAGKQYTPRANYSSEVKNLMTQAGVTENGFDSFDSELTELLERELPLRAKPQGAKPEDITRTLELAKRGYNSAAAIISIANYLTREFRSDQISEINRLYNDPLLRRALDSAKDKTVDKSAYEIYSKNQEKTPLSEQRHRALDKLVRVSHYDKLLLSIWSAGQNTLAELTSISINKPRSINQRQEDAREVQDMASYIENAIRAEAIKQLAWIYKDYSLLQLGDLTTSYNKPLLKRFQKVVRTGIDSYFSDASFWVKEKSSRTN